MRISILAVAAFGAAAFAADLPVTEVVLYKNGIGYFQRSGRLAGGESARLEFKAAYMNDVLKSLRIVEDGGGGVTGLRYDSSEPLSERLSEFPFNYPNGAPLTAFLDQLRGARVELQAGAETISGVIVAAREAAAEPTRPRREDLTVMLDSGDLRVVDLSGLSAIRFAEPALQAQLREFLATIARSRSREKRAVYIDSTGTETRKVDALYVIPVPAWKSSYRLALKPAGGQPVLEGWAIVDNTTGEDWSKVKLAVVSGKPVSFITNLYEPRYVEREEAELEEMAAAKPKVYGAGVPSGTPGGVIGGIAGPVAEARRAAAPPPPMPFAGAPREARDLAQIAPGVLNTTSSVARTTIAREAGELFEYRFDTPVTVRAGESAMLPFVQQPVGARRLLVYSSQHDQDSGHPRNAVELDNGTGKTLDGGPITVFDSGSYAGEALMDTLKAGDKRLISYAIDLGATISDEAESTRSDVRELHFSRGVLTARNAERTTTTYTIRNADAKAKTLYIEHPIEQDTQLVSPKPVETAKNVYRFEVKIGPRATEKLVVVQDGNVDTTYSITSATPDFLAVFARNTNLPQRTRDQVNDIVRRKAAIATLASETARLETERKELAAEQVRLRENINTLRNVSGQQDQVQNYARRLAAAEGEIATLRDRIHETGRKRAEADTELKNLIDNLEF